MHAIKMSLAKPSYEDGGWLIEEVLGLGSGTILYGPPGVGKTNIVCTMLAALEAGGTWAGQRVHGSQHKVIYLDLDASQAQTMPRAWAAYNSLGVTAGGKENLFYISRLEEQCLVPGDPKELGEAIALMVKTMGASLVIVDSFLQIRTGDSNNADAVREACQLVFDPARKLGAAVLVLDHNSKPSVANPSGGKSPQGSVGKLGWCRIAVQVTAKEKKTDGNRTRVKLTLENTKTNFRGFESIPVDLHLETSPDERLDKLYLAGDALPRLDAGVQPHSEQTAPSNGDGSKAAQARVHILEMLRKGETLGRTLTQNRDETYRKALTALGNEGIVRNPERGRYVLA